MRIRCSCRQSDTFVLAIITQADQKTPFQPQSREDGCTTQVTRVTQLLQQQMVREACFEEQDGDVNGGQRRKLESEWNYGCASPPSTSAA